MLAEWNSSFSVGNEVLDGQHKTLFSLINQLHEGIINNRRRETLSSALDGALKYTLLHFATEEDIMRRHGYPDLDKHAGEHKVLVNKLTEYKKRLDSGQEDLTLEVLMELIDWLHTHLGDSDSRYRPFITGKPAQ